MERRKGHRVFRTLGEGNTPVILQVEESVGGCLQTRIHKFKSYLHLLLVGWPLKRDLGLQHFLDMWF